MNEQNLRPLAALLMTQSLAAIANAQTTNAPAATNATTQLPDVTVQGQGRSPYKPETLSSPKYTEPLRDIPQTITVIPQAVIREQGATSLRDILRNVSGISMQAGEGGGGLPGDNLSIRGFNSRSDVFIDGVRDSGAYSRDPFNVEQVEVAKGPSSTTTGRGSTGGSINLSSKAPQLGSFYAGTAGFGTDDYKRFTADVNQSLEGEDGKGLNGAALRFNALWHESGVAGRDIVENNRWAVAPSLAFGLGTPTRLTLSFLHMTQDNVPEYGIPWVTANNTNAVLIPYRNAAPPVSFDNFYGLKGYDFEDVDNDVVTAKLEHDFNDSLSVRNLFRYDRTYRNSAITAPRFADLNPGTAVQESTLLNRQLQRREMTTELFANQTDLTADFTTGPVDHTGVTGLELSRENQDNRNSAQTANQPQTDVFNPNPNALPLGPMPPITGVPNEVTVDTLALYAFDTLKFGEHWQLSGGLRWDHVDADYQSDTNQLNQVQDLLSYRAALTYKPRENGSIYFGYGTSFNPSIEAGNTGLSLATNNASLDPEETQTFEFGTKWDLFNGRLGLSAAIFHTEKLNARTPGLNPGDPSIVLDGELVVDGFEFGASGSITKNWKLTASYAYLESEVKQSNTASEVGAEFGNAPAHSFSLWTTYDLPCDLQVGGGAQYLGTRLNNLSSNTNVRRAPDYLLFDAMLAYEVNKNVTLRLNVNNLTDERYIDRVGGGHFVPGAGRSAMLTAEFSF